MILSFTRKNGDNCYFDVNGLSVSRSEITYDSIALYINDTPYDGSYETWSGNKLSDDDIFDQVVNAYIRNDSTDYSSFGNEWSVIDPILKNMDYDSNLDIAITLPVIEFDEVSMYHLDMATTEFRFYSHEDSFLLLNDNGGVVTDYENFFMTAMEEEYEKISNGSTECLYINPDVEEYLAEEFGDYDDEDYED